MGDWSRGHAVRGEAVLVESVTVAGGGAVSNGSQTTWALVTAIVTLTVSQLLLGWSLRGLG